MGVAATLPELSEWTLPRNFSVGNSRYKVQKWHRFKCRISCNGSEKEIII